MLAAEVGDYIALARRRGSEWYVGAMTDWTSRELTLDLSFLGPGKYSAEVFEDGVNADRNASDYRHTEGSVKKGDRLTDRLAPGGGWVARIRGEAPGVGREN